MRDFPFFFLSSQWHVMKIIILLKMFTFLTKILNWVLKLFQVNMTDTEIFQFETIDRFLLQGSWRLVSHLFGIIASQELFSRSTIFFYFQFSSVPFAHLSDEALFHQWTLSTFVPCVMKPIAKVWGPKKNLQIAAIDSLLLKKYNLICNFSDCKICNAHPFLNFYSNFGNTQYFKMCSLLWWGRV